MPIYEYRCRECGEKFEWFVRSLNQAAAPICPKCQSQKVEKNISLFGVGGGSGGQAAASCNSGPT